MKKLRTLIIECILLLEYDEEKTLKQHGPKMLKAAMSSHDTHKDIRNFWLNRNYNSEIDEKLQKIKNRP